MRIIRLILFLMCCRSALPAQMQIAGISASPATCSTNGSVTVSVSGGTPIYCYRVNGGDCLYSADPVFTFTDLSPGTKVITVTNGPNTATVSATIEVPGNYQAPSLIGTVQGCGVLAKVSGGQPPYQYAISRNNGSFSAFQADPFFTPVAGVYCLRVSDACNNFTEYCGLVEVSPIEFTATCCNSPAIPTEICVKLTDRQGLSAADPGYWFGGVPPYTYSATATGLTVYNPKGAFQLPQLCPGWSFSVTDACGNTASQVPSCMYMDVMCVDCKAGTAEVKTTNGVPPYVYYYQDAAGGWQPNPAGGTSGSFSGLPPAGAGKSYTFRTLDACGNVSKPIEIACLDAKGSYNCLAQTVTLEPLTKFFPVSVTCQNCAPVSTINLPKAGGATFPVASGGENIFTLTDACGAMETFVCHDTLPSVAAEYSCNSIVAKMRSNYVCNGRLSQPFDVLTGVRYDLALAKQPQQLIASSNDGRFDNLLPGEAYIVTATHPFCGAASDTFELYKPGDFALSFETKTTSFLQNSICQTGFDLAAQIKPAANLAPVFRLTGPLNYTASSGKFSGIAPGNWTLSVDNYCLSRSVVLPDWKPEMKVELPECPNGGCVQMSGARTNAEWVSWGAPNSLNMMSTSDFYILNCPGFNGPQCVANWGGNICNLIPGNAYSVYLLPGTFTCPVDTITFALDPAGTARIDSVLYTTPVACDTASTAAVQLTIMGGKEPLYLEVIDSLSGQVLTTLYDQDLDHKIEVYNLEALKTYFFRVVDACNNTKDASATVILLPSVTAGYTYNCSGKLKLHTAAVFNALYTWKDASGGVIATGPNLWEVETGAPPAATNFTVEIDFGNCPPHLTGVSVPGFPPSEVSLLFADTLFCKSFNIGLTAATGPGNYTYIWNTGATTQSISVSTPGTYTIIATNTFGCRDTAAASIAYSPSMSLSLTKTDVDCFGATSGALFAEVSGGTPAIGYIWENGDTSRQRKNLKAGQYRLTVSDAQGCSLTLQTSIIEPPPLTLSLATTDVSCFGAADGSAQAAAMGGTAPYTYLWENNSQNNAITALVADVYAITVTDAKACQRTDSVTVKQPPSLALSITPENIRCFAESSGSIGLAVNGGTPPYGYLWSNNATTANLQNLPAGDYTVTVTDKNGCTRTANAALAQPGLFSTAIAATDVRCAGIPDGTLTATVNGGIPAGLKFKWNTGATDSILPGLSPGAYTVTATDGNGCTATAQSEIKAPPPLLATTTATPDSCHDAKNGTVSTTVSGGSPAYHFEWNSALGNSPSVQGLGAGNYTVTVTDQNGCTATASALIKAPPPLLLNLTPAPARCFGENNGSIIAVANGGTPAYTYLWSNGAVLATQQNLPAGTYTVTVADQNACTSTASATVVQPDSFGVAISGKNIRCAAAPNGSLVATSAGGTGSASYAWNNGAKSAAVTGLPAGIYTVTATDGNGCTARAQSELSAPPLLTITTSATPDSCFNAKKGSVAAVASGGVSPYLFAWSESQTAGPVMTGLAAGTYTVTVIDQNGCTAAAAATVTTPSPLTLSLESTQVSCFGRNNGNITTVVKGGISPYNYKWSDGMTTPSLQNLPAGSYTVTVADQNGCTVVQSLVISQPDTLGILSVSATDAGCTGDKGTLTLKAVGGTRPYSVVWNNGKTGMDLEGLGPGAYAFTLTDAQGCSIHDSAVVPGVAPLQVEISVQPVSCFGKKDGAVYFENITGGIGPPYLLDGAIRIYSGDFVGGLSGGAYTYVLSDGRNCAMEVTAVITEPPPFSFSLPEVVHIELGEEILLQPQPSGTPSPPISWQWIPRDSLSCDSCAVTKARPVRSQLYRLLATDANGCTVSDAVQVIVKRECPVYIANVLAPLRDSDNALLTIQTGSCVQRIVQWNIYDRWGGLVFAQKDFMPNTPKHAWDGTVRSKRVETGVYTWYAIVEWIDGQQVMISGDVTVVY